MLVCSCLLFLSQRDIFRAMDNIMGKKVLGFSLAFFSSCSVLLICLWVFSFRRSSSQNKHSISRYRHVVNCSNCLKACCNRGWSLALSPWMLAQSSGGFDLGLENTLVPGWRYRMESCMQCSFSLNDCYWADYLIVWVRTRYEGMKWGIQNVP